MSDSNPPAAAPTPAQQPETTPLGGSYWASSAAPSAPPPEPTPPPAPTKRNRRGLTVALVAVVVVVAVGLFLALRPKPSPITEAAEKCKVTAVVRDDGDTLSFGNVGAEENPGPDDIDAVACVLVALSAPDRVASHIDTTRALDGQQTDQWGEYSARWTYHPKSGLNVTVIHQG